MEKLDALCPNTSSFGGLILANYILTQMTVVEAYVGKKKIDPPEDGSQFPTAVSSLLDEGLAQNTAGSVFLSKVLLLGVRVLEHTQVSRG